MSLSDRFKKFIEGVCIFTRLYIFDDIDDIDSIMTIISKYVDKKRIFFS